MLVSVLVEAHSAPLCELKRGLAVEGASGGVVRIFERGQRFAHIAARIAGYGGKHAVIAVLCAVFRA